MSLCHFSPELVKSLLSSRSWVDVVVLESESIVEPILQLPSMLPSSQMTVNAMWIGMSHMLHSHRSRSRRTLGSLSRTRRSESPWWTRGIPLRTCRTVRRTRGTVTRTCGIPLRTRGTVPRTRGSELRTRRTGRRTLDTKEHSLALTLIGQVCVLTILILARSFDLCCDQFAVFHLHVGKNGHVFAFELLNFLLLLVSITTTSLVTRGCQNLWITGKREKCCERYPRPSRISECN